MHPQLEILLQLQDLKTQRRELAEGQAERQVEEQEFHIDIERALEEIDRKVAEMETELSPPIRSRYQRLAGRGRAVVPVINGICYGCFVAIPTARGSSSGNVPAPPQSCDHCGRFLYVML